MGSYKDVLALAIATLAVVVSLITVVLQQRQQKREAYRGLFEMLMSEQLQRGRWLVVAIQQASAVSVRCMGRLLQVAELMGFAAASGRGGWRHAGAGC
jgi:hypothetical protein